MNRLVLTTAFVYNKNTALNKWKNGESFQVYGTCEYTSIRSLSELRGNYSSIVIQYDKGVIEV